jgi:hypothetical protein
MAGLQSLVNHIGAHPKGTLLTMAVLIVLVIILAATTITYHHRWKKGETFRTFDPVCSTAPWERASARKEHQGLVAVGATTQ